MSSHLTRRPTDPYTARVRLQGTTDLHFHSYLGPTPGGWEWPLPETVDQLMSVPWRTPGGTIGVPGLWVVASVLEACRSFPDPRHPSRSAAGLYSQALETVTPLADTAQADWGQIIDSSPATAAEFPAKYVLCLNKGWVATFDVRVTMPEYVPPDEFHEKLIHAGLRHGLGLRRWVRGLFHATLFEVVTPEDAGGGR